jgi:Tfp pilus assembly protein FimT
VLRKDRKLDRSESGISLVELLIVVIVGLILSGIGVLSFVRSRESAHLNSALQLTVNQLRMARQEAMDKRLQYIVTLLPPRSIQTQWSATGIAATTERTISLPSDVQFSAEPGLPGLGSTPDGFGAGTLAIDFCQATGGGGTQILFNPDGTAMDAAGNPNDGVVYLALPGNLASSRAITLFGATGRLKVWSLVRKGATPVWR